MQFRKAIQRLASRLAADDEVTDVPELLARALVHRLTEAHELDLAQSDALSVPAPTAPPPGAVRDDLRATFAELVTDPTTDYLGEFHQAIHSGEWRVASGESRPDGESRRATGTFYTPRDLTRFVVDRTLGRRLYGTRDGRPNGERIEGRESLPPTRAAELRLLDPAAGTGVFLREAHRTLREFYANAGLPEGFDGSPAALAVRQLYGVDRDERAVDFARLNLAFDTAAHGGDLDACDAVLASNLRTANALLFERWPDAETNETLDLDFAGGRPCRWRRAFPDVFEKGGFDIVVGNPPWVSYGLRDAGALDEREKDYLRDQFDAAEYKLPLYPLFMELGLRLARPGGLTSFVVPDSFLVGSRFSKIRELLVDAHGLEMVTLLPDGLWADGTSGRTVVYRAASGKAGSTKVVLRHIDDTDDTEAGHRSVARSRIAEAPGCRIEVFADGAVDRFVDRVRRAEARVEDLVELYSGCIAAFGQASIVAKSPQSEHVIRDRSGEVVWADEEAESRWRPLVSSGREVDKYGRPRADKFIYVHPDPDVRRRYFKSGHDLERYRAPKLLMRQTGDAPVVAWEDEGYFCLNNLHVVDPLPGTAAAELRALLGVLNSRTMRVFYQAVTMERGRALAQTDIETVERLPVPGIAEAVEALADPVAALIEEPEDEASIEEVDEGVGRLFGVDRAIVEEVAEALN